MKSSDLSEFEIEQQGLKLRIKRDNGKMMVTPTVIQAPMANQALSGTAAAVEPVAEEEKGISIVKAPMVGTFYNAPSPDKDAFAAVGTKVSKDSVVCIIEAMKVMNEIQSEISGTIVEVLVENEAAIEFGQPLFKVKTS